MDIVILVPAVVTCEKHLEMVRVQSLLRDRLRIYDHTSRDHIHSCIIFDAISPPLIHDALGLDFSLKLIGSHLYPDESAPSGIRRPVEFALRALSKTFRPAEFTYVLRVIQDAFIDDAQSLLNSLKGLLDRREDFVAGELASCSDIGPLLDEVGIPRANHYAYIQGSVMFARLDVWLTHYSRMPAGVTHFCDDSVMSQLARHAGSELVPMTRHWRHLHDCPSGDLAQIYLQHSKELAGDVTAAHSLLCRRNHLFPPLLR